MEGKILIQLKGDFGVAFSSSVHVIFEAYETALLADVLCQSLRGIGKEPKPRVFYSKSVFIAHAHFEWRRLVAEARRPPTFEMLRY